MKIYKLNEQFAQSFSGDGFNTSNGVFKVKYKPFDDLSVSRGRDPIPSHYVRGEEFQIGDRVKGVIKGSKKKVTGEIVSLSKNSTSTEFRFKVKSDKTNKIYSLVPASVEKVQDMGYQTQTAINPDSSKNKFQTNIKYGMGNMVWRSLESFGTDDNIMVTKNGMKKELKGVIDPELDLKFVTSKDDDSHRSNFDKMGIAYMDPAKNTIFIDDEHPDSSKLTNDHLAAIEAHEIAHQLINNYDDDELEIICDLLAAKILRNKGYTSPYKVLVSNFMGRHGKSYGEALDKHQNFLQGISY